MSIESIASETANKQDRASVPSILDEFLELQAANAFYHKKRPSQSHTQQRSTKTRAKGSTGNQGVTAITRGIKHRKRAAYLWGRVDRPIKEKKLTIQYGQNIYRQLEIFL